MTVPKYSWKISRVFAQRGVGVQEDDALRFKVLTQLVVDDLGLVLGGDAGNQALRFGLGDAELVVGVPDVLGQFLPAGGLLLGGTHEVLDVVEVDAGEVCTPGGHGLAVEVLQALEPEIEHPFRLALLGRDVTDHFFIDTAAGVGADVVLVGPAVLVGADAVELGILFQNLRDHSVFGYRFL